MEDSESWEVQCECSVESFSPWEAFPSLAAPLPARARAEIPGRVCSLELAFALLCSAVTSRCLSKAARALQPSLTPSKSPECLPWGVPLVPAHPMELGIPSLGQEAAPGTSPALGAHGAPVPGGFGTPPCASRSPGFIPQPQQAQQVQTVPARVESCKRHFPQGAAGRILHGLIPHSNAADKYPGKVFNK